MAENPYTILGVTAAATPSEIKKAYRRKALRCHPDAVGAGGEAEFRKVHEAYESLCGHDPGEGSVRVHTEPPPGPRMGGHAKRSVTVEPPHSPLELILDEREASEGLSLSFSVSMEVACPSCHGLGLFSFLCPVCDGRGTLSRPIRAYARVPAGITQGEIVRATGATPGLGVVTIDLHVVIAGR